MKTILSILEVLLYNLLPAVVAAPLIVLMKEMIPLAAVSCMQAMTYMKAWFQKLGMLLQNYRMPVQRLEGFFNK